MDKTMHTAWGMFRTVNIADDAPDFQLRDMQCAYFAGAHALLKLIITIAELPQDRIEKIMEGVKLELEDHVKKMNEEYSEHTN